MPLFIGLDIGTSRVKVALFDKNGQLIALSSKENFLMMKGSCVELDAEHCWRQIVNGIRELTRQVSIPPSEVVAISLSSQGQTFLPVDEHGRPLSNAYVWLDQRATMERDEIVQQFGREQIYRRNGLSFLTPGNFSSLLLWLRKHKPQLFDQAYKFVHISDYVQYKLSNRFIAERPIYSCMGVYDLTTHSWWLSMLDYLALSPHKLPELINAGEQIGTLSAAVAQQTHLPDSTYIISGTLDVSATALGSNSLSSHRLAVSLGTTLQTNLTMHHFEYVPGRYDIWIFGHVIPDAYVGVLWRETAGFTLQWFRDVFCQQEIEQARKMGADAYDLLTHEAASIPPGSENLFFLPYLCGTQLPESHPELRGIIYGLAPIHKKAHFIRALLEGVGYMLRENLEIYRDLGWECEEIWLTGGGAKSKVWTQILADITDRPIYLLQCNEASALGAAILASVGAGVYTDLFQACQRMVHATGIVLPKPDHRHTYDDGYCAYKDLYRRNKDFALRT